MLRILALSCLVVLTGCQKGYYATVTNQTDRSITVAVVKTERLEEDMIIDSAVVPPGEHRTVGRDALFTKWNILLEVASGSWRDSMVLDSGKTNAEAVAVDGRIKVRLVGDEEDEASEADEPQF